MSQKHCSLALEEVKNEERADPEFELLVNKAYLKSSDSFLHVIASQNTDDAVKIKGRIIVSF